MKTLLILSSILLLHTPQVYGKNVIVPETQTFEPKTIHISSTGGGISHIAWTLEIGKVLAQRGHNVSFITTDPNVKFGAPFQPDIKTISMGPHVSEVDFRDLFDIDMPFLPAVTQAYRTIIQDTYKRDYYTYLHIFESSNTNLAICDQMALPCFDAAKKLNIPMIIHMTMSLSEDTRAPFITSFHTTGPPTTKHLSFKQRFYDRFISLPRFLYRFYPVGKVISKMRKDIGVEGFDPLGRHSGVIKMINSFWGMESPRPVGPFVEYVGPIIGTSYDALPENMAQFMQEHNNVVYVAFGQMYTPNAQEFEVLLKSLLEAYENGYLDGFIWSLSLKARQQYISKKLIRTSSGKLYNVQDLTEHDSDTNLRFETWSPQFAILNHPHCKLFISHGGASSIHESLFNGVPLLLHPFTSDQPANAYTMNGAGVGLILDRKAHNVTDTLTKISTIILDKEGQFKSNMKSMQALVQLRSSKRKMYAADMIEEVLHTVRNSSQIWYRKEASEKMGIFKAKNWDINLTALVGVISFVIILFTAITKIYALLRFLFVSPKKWKTA